MASMFKLALGFACIAIALLVGAAASNLTRKDATPTPDAMGADEPERTPVATRPIVVPTQNVIVATPPAPVAPASSDGSLPLTFTCPQGWTAQNVTGRRYAFCTPPGWSARIGAANVPRIGEPEGSAVRAVSAEQ